MSTLNDTIEQITDFLASVKLALVLLMVLAITAVVGTIVPQNLAPQQYLHAYGPRLYTFLSYLDVFDMYRSWWFTALLAFLTVNLLVCSTHRLPKTIRLIKSVKPEKVTIDFLQKQAFVVLETIPAPVTDISGPLQTTFSRGFSRPRETTASWGTLLHSEKGAFSRFGVYVVHASILVIIAGAIVGNRWGFSAYLNLPEGQTATQVEGERPAARITLPFGIKLDKFVVEFYPNGMPSEYRSDLTVLEGNRPVLSTSIRVNHPLTYRDITFYQSSYGQVPGGSRGVAGGPLYYSGLQVRYDPGVTLIWIGCGMMLTGFLVAFFFAHQKLYLGLIIQGNQTRVVLAGSSHRNQGSFKIKFEQMASAIRQIAVDGGKP